MERSQGDIPASSNEATAAASERPEETPDWPTEAEMALLALAARDTGGPTEEVDLAGLTPAERAAVLRLLRDRLGLDKDEPTGEAGAP